MKAACWGRAASEKIVEEVDIRTLGAGHSGLGTNESGTGARLGLIAGATVQEMRESLGVRLEGSVVIIDEAHNIVDAVNGVHSATLSARQLATAQSALDNYYQRFSTRLAPGLHSGICLLGIKALACHEQLVNKNSEGRHQAHACQCAMQVTASIYRR